MKLMALVTMTPHVETWRRRTEIQSCDHMETRMRETTTNP